jgi:hypothetical protein
MLGAAPQHVCIHWAMPCQAAASAVIMGPWRACTAVWQQYCGGVSCALSFDCAATSRHINGWVVAVGSAAWLAHDAPCVVVLHLSVVSTWAHMSLVHTS